MKYKFNKFITEISEFRQYQVCETTIILADTLEQAWELFSNDDIDPEKSKTIETVCEEAS
jgi:predicted metal-dependent peptidase